ncbi:MAG TPA: hypothetical protein VK543_09885 [Puia sp.]|nr:hypothetical protein [Puia sp.]
MTKAEEYFGQLSKEIPGVKPGKMFGALCMKTANGKSAAMFWKDNLVVKLQGDALKEAMRLKGAKLFEPMEGRPMKEWVQIPFAFKGKWKELAITSAESVKTLK